MRVMVRMFFVDANLFLAARTVFFLGEIYFEGRVAIFPSDALLGDLSFDSGDSGLCFDVVFVRRWEKAEGDWDFGVKVQVDVLRGIAVS